MENNINETLIMENTTVHTSKLSKKYVRSITNNFIALEVFIGICGVASLVMALTCYSIAWFPVGLVVICETIIVVLNVNSIKNGKKEMEKFEGAIYDYKFYDDHFDVNYTLREDQAFESITYKAIKNASRVNGVLAIVLSNNSVLFLDEETVENKDNYNVLLNKIKAVIDENTSVKKKKRK